MERDQKVYASVILDKGLDFPLEYEACQSAKFGCRVTVPLRNRPVSGTIIEIYDEKKTKNPHEILNVEAQVLSKDALKLAKFISNYWCTSLRKVLSIMLPKAVKKDTQEKKRKLVKAKKTKKELVDAASSLRAKSSKQAEVIDQILKESKLYLKDLPRSSVESLVKKGIVEIVEEEVLDLLDGADFFSTKPKTLNSEQQVALDAYQKTIDENAFRTHLLYGVTGSGKTEVYLRAIQHALSQNKSVIFMVPEIALTEQTIERVRSRFPEEKIGVWHHRLSDGERNRLWTQMQEGTLKFLIGARSSIFCPLQNLGLIIVDEEHETSYKQSDEMPCYNGRDVAIVRGQIEKVCVVLGSATPTLETYTNALSGKYQLHTLKTRPTSHALPHIQIINMCKEYEKNKGWTLFSEPLIKGIEERLKKGEQTLLFLNRRGYNTTLLCPTCEQIVECPHCSVPLTFHRSKQMLLCHLCTHEKLAPRNCTACGHETLKYKGSGTEQIESILRALFQDIRILRMDADTTKQKGKHQEIYKKFASHKADVLVGTQMIAKGLHFPNVSLVGVLQADHLLHLPDFRATELVFQQITQVSGRSGRGDLKGEVILQTTLPDHPVMEWAKTGAYQEFYDEEIKIRESFSYPPDTKIIKLLFTGPIERLVQQEGYKIREKTVAAMPKGCTIFPLIPSPIPKIKDTYRYQFLLVAKNIQPALEWLQKKITIDKKVRLRIDVDPI